MPGESATPRRPNRAGRSDYAVVSSTARQVLLAANAADLTGRQHRILNAVIAYTALYSRLEDRVYLAQIAAFAHGVEHAEPWMLKKTRETLAELVSLGLVHTRAPRGRPPLGLAGPAYLVGLTRQEKDPAAGVHSQEKSDPAAGVRSEAESDPACGPKVTPPADRKGPRVRTESDPAAGGESDPAAGPPTEETSEETPEESAEEGRRADRPPHARPHPATVGSLAARLAACATTNGTATKIEAERVAQVVTDHLPPAAAHHALDEILTAGPINRPVQLLSALAYELDPDSEELAAITNDPRSHGLQRYPAAAIADICASTNGTTWTDHLDEALAVARHLEQHAPRWAVDDMLNLAQRDGLRRPAHAADRAAEFAAEFDLDVPRFERPRARKPGRR